MATTAPDIAAHWSLDKRVPIALIATVVLQTFLAGWFVSALVARLEEAEKKIEAVTPYANRLTILETKLEGMSDILKDIRSDLRRDRQSSAASPDQGRVRVLPR